MKKNTAGFTLIELMIVVAIIGILSAIAYPSYTAHVLKGRRVIAQSELMAFVSAMEQYYVQNGSNYRTPADGVPDVYSTTGAPMYTLAATNVTASTYTITATPNSGTSQYGNGYIRITNEGAKSWDSPDGLVNYWD